MRGEVERAELPAHLLLLDSFLKVSRTQVTLFCLFPSLLPCKPFSSPLERTRALIRASDCPDADAA